MKTFLNKLILRTPKELIYILIPIFLSLFGYCILSFKDNIESYFSDLELKKSQEDSTLNQLKIQYGMMQADSVIMENYAKRFPDESALILYFTKKDIRINDTIVDMAIRQTTRLKLLIIEDQGKLAAFKDHKFHYIYSNIYTGTKEHLDKELELIKGLELYINNKYKNIKQEVQFDNDFLTLQSNMLELYKVLNRQKNIFSLSRLDSLHKEDEQKNLNIDNSFNKKITTAKLFTVWSGLGIIFTAFIIFFLVYILFQQHKIEKGIIVKSQIVKTKRKIR